MTEKENSNDINLLGNVGCLNATVEDWDLMVSGCCLATGLGVVTNWGGKGGKKTMGLYIVVCTIVQKGIRVTLLLSAVSALQRSMKKWVYLIGDHLDLPCTVLPHNRNRKHHGLNR